MASNEQTGEWTSTHTIPVLVQETITKIKQESVGYPGAGPLSSTESRRLAAQNLHLAGRFTEKYNETAIEAYLIEANRQFRWGLEAAKLAPALLKPREEMASLHYHRALLYSIASINGIEVGTLVEDEIRSAYSEIGRARGLGGKKYKEWKESMKTRILQFAEENGIDLVGLNGAEEIGHLLSEHLIITVPAEH